MSCDFLVGAYIRFNLTKQWDASFFRWYDTGQAHILSNSIIRNCGVRSLDDVEFDEYNQSPERGCPFDDSNLGCDNDSSVWSFNSVRCTLHPFLLGKHRRTLTHLGTPFLFSIRTSSFLKSCRPQQILRTKIAVDASDSLKVIWTRLRQGNKTGLTPTEARLALASQH
jgi:hypothetical protein